MIGLVYSFSMLLSTLEDTTNILPRNYPVIQKGNISTSLCSINYGLQLIERHGFDALVYCTVYLRV